MARNVENARCFRGNAQRFFAPYPSEKVGDVVIQVDVMIYFVIISPANCASRLWLRPQPLSQNVRLGLEKKSETAWS